MEVAFEENFGVCPGVANGFLAEGVVFPEDVVKKQELHVISDVTRDETSRVCDQRNERAVNHRRSSEGEHGLPENKPKPQTDAEDAHTWCTVSRTEVPLLLREPYVEQGFRPLNRPWAFYIRSALHLHNESMNVWTHVIAVALTSVQLWLYSKRLDFLHDPYTWPMLAGLLCGITLYGCSTFAHCCHSRSEYVHYVAFMVDYAGIGLYGLGSVIVHIMYCSEDDFYDAVHPFFIPLGCIFAFQISLCQSIAKVRYQRPYPFVRKIWQMVPVLSIYALLVSPVAHRLGVCYWYGVDCTDSIPYHIQQVIWFFTSGFFFASDIPQRFLHGKCDIFGHSHQLFHIAIAISTLFQMHAVNIDFHTRNDVIRSRPEPTFFSAFGPVLIVVALEAACILFFSVHVARKLRGGHAKQE